MRLILGSQSPRRKEILGYFSIPFEQVTPPFIEEDVPFEGEPGKHAILLSEGKAQSISHLYPSAVIITADTIVFGNGKSYVKATDKEDAFNILSELSGRWHSVFTGVTVRKGDQHYSAVEETRVLFNELTPEQIHQYLKQLHWQDKAGAYAVQHAGAIITQKIEGCFYNVMGLPINTLRKLLLPVGIDLWGYLKI